MNRTSLAARNNADLYEAVFEAHGVAFERTGFAFLARGAPPPYYSHMTVTAPGHGAVLSRLVAERARPGFNLKDSFLEIDPAAHGLVLRFEATWLWRAPGPRGADPGWRRADDLSRWEAAWKATSPTERRMFPDAMLGRDDLAFLIAGEGEGIAGCLANRSEGAVGLSNVFGPPNPATFLAAADAVAALAPDVPVVGYEAGDVLPAARAAGFDATGRLRVLAAPGED